MKWALEWGVTSLILNQIDVRIYWYRNHDR